MIYHIIEEIHTYWLLKLLFYDISTFSSSYFWYRKNIFSFQYKFFKFFKFLFIIKQQLLNFYKVLFHTFIRTSFIEGAVKLHQPYIYCFGETFIYFVCSCLWFFKFLCCLSLHKYLVISGQLYFQNSYIFGKVTITS